MTKNLLRSFMMLLAALVLFTACGTKDDEVEPDNGLETGDVFDIGSSSAKININLSVAGDITIDEKGICWNTTGKPTVEDETHRSGSGPGSYTGNLTGLTPKTNYRVRPYYITDEGKTEYGKEVSFTTEDSPFVGEWSNQSGSLVYTGTQNGLIFKYIGESSVTLSWWQTYQRGYVKLGDAYIKNARQSGTSYKADALWYWGTSSEGVKGVEWGSNTTITFRNNGKEMSIEAYSPITGSYSSGTLYKK
ncbi:hypothetical protein H7F15_06475 [Pontibacter sp. Tf4]|uniref:hypothetical protein n=1 Tax=Pontibacter sp. Tf4 TaxID=2761620 RepID=UPI00162A6787|nr:hypothetical protein [Pontibacter sp. Tf4]MBB6610675.1 hypothetical protein [Pontibacter sp. Tf4]